MSEPLILHNCLLISKMRAFLVAQLVKILPVILETGVRFLGWKDPLENGTATHSSILAWRIPWTIPWGCKELDTTEQLSLSKSMVKVGLDLKWNDFFNVLIDSDRKVEFYC